MPVNGESEALPAEGLEELPPPVEGLEPVPPTEGLVVPPPAGLEELLGVVGVVPDVPGDAAGLVARAWASLLQASKSA